MKTDQRLLVQLLVFVSLAATAPAAPAPAKKLIEFGWDEPDTRFLREHIAEMQRTPCDGCVFRVDYAKPGGGEGSFTWEGWGTPAPSPKPT